MKGHVALLVVLLLFGSGCASRLLLPIEVSGRADIWAKTHTFTPETSTVPETELHRPILILLRAWSLRNGYSIAYADIAADGYVGQIVNHHVLLDVQLTSDGELNTLLHELAHDLIPFDGTLGEREAVAEVVAYMVAQNLSWHTPESLGYISGVPTDIRASILMKYEKDILRTVGILTKACGH